MDGHTMKEVIDATGASKSVISYHFRRTKIKDTKRFKRRLNDVKVIQEKSLVKGTISNQEKWNIRRNEISEEARKEWEFIRTDPEMMGFLGLYWGEGDKAASNIGITNNDAGVIMASIKIFNRLDPGMKLRVLIRCNGDQDFEESKRFWESALGLTVIVRKKDWIGKKLSSRSQYGICRIRYSSWRTKQKILTWIDCWREELKVPDYLS